MVKRSFLLGSVVLLLTCFVPLSAIAKDLLVSSFFSNKVGRYDQRTGAYIGDFQAAGLSGPLATRLGPDGLMYVTSEGSNQVKRYNWRTGAFVDNFVTGGAEGLSGPTGIDWDANGDLIVGSFNNHSIFKYDGQSGAFLSRVVAPSQGGLQGPDNGMIFGSDGLLYVPSYYSNQILRYDLDAGTSEVFINGIGRPRVLVFDEDQLYITSETADAVQRYDLDGNFVDNFIAPGSGVLDTPVGLALHNNEWYVSSATQDRVLKFDREGNLLDANFLTTGGIDGPTFLTVAVPEPRAYLLLLVLVPLALLVHLWKRRGRRGKSEVCVGE